MFIFLWLCNYCVHIHSPFINQLTHDFQPDDHKHFWRRKFPQSDGWIAPIQWSNGASGNLSKWKRSMIQYRHQLGGFKHFWNFHPEPLGKWSNLTNVFQMGWNQQLVKGDGKHQWEFMRIHWNAGSIASTHKNHPRIFQLHWFWKHWP